MINMLTLPNRGTAHKYGHMRTTSGIGFVITLFLAVLDLKEKVLIKLSGVFS